MNKNKGSIIFTFLLVLILTALSAGIVMRGVLENRVAQRNANSTTAVWVAEAGIHRASWEYESNNCVGMVRAGTSTACVSCTNCGGGNKTVAVTLSGFGDYDATIDNGNTTITSTGSVPSRTDPNMITRAIRATIPNNALFTYAAFSQGSMDVSNNTTIDSYNSANGLYGGGNILTNGDIGSNGTSSGIIDVGNNAVIKGDISTGPGGTVDLSNGVTVTGTTTHTNNVSLASVSVPSSLTSLPPGNTYSVSGTADLPAGNYKYTDINMANNSVLNINGAVNIYLTGSSSMTTGNGVTININSGASLVLYVDGVLTIANNATVNNVNKVPADVLIYSAYTGEEGVNLSNNGAFYAAVYAPQTDVAVSNNSGFYGAVIGKTVDVSNNGGVHYDQALANLQNPFVSSAVLASWQEL